MASLCTGLKNLLLVSIVYGIGIIVYTFARKEQGNRCFVGAEKYVMWAIIVAAITSIYMLLTGNIKCKKSFSFKGLFLCLENIYYIRYSGGMRMEEKEQLSRIIDLASELRKVLVQESF